MKYLNYVLFTVGRLNGPKCFSIKYSIATATCIRMWFWGHRTFYSVRTAYSFITVIPAVVDAVITSRTWHTSGVLTRELWRHMALCNVINNIIISRDCHVAGLYWV